MSDRKSSADVIMEQFNREVHEIAELITKVPDIPKPQKSDFIGNIRVKLAEARMMLAENEASLPSHDLQKLGKKLLTYDNRLRDLAFKTGELHQYLTDNDDFESEEESEQSSEEKSEEIVGSELSDFDNTDSGLNNTDAELLKSLSDRENAILRIKLPTEMPQALRIRNVKECSITICCLMPAADLYLARDSNIILYPVRTSVMIEGCINCTIACVAQQIRVKDSINCRLFVYTTGTTLLEECNAIKIGPYNVSFPDKEEIFKEAGFGESENKWKEVEDFKAVNSGTPAFTIMNENEWEEFHIE
ncbi:Tubulin-specific chaperone C [Trichinella pseudospiralis]|nr:Tubulin-specific chaperone C [Trichinella pseudospiralis]KRZ24840.1 Tubulin-specific chaperone C [Trichinella pseudospiralis]KRZ42165.1 Tubulin-specific chaperone C [Trichinella pseudospiralis]